MPENPEPIDEVLDFDPSPEELEDLFREVEIPDPVSAEAIDDEKTATPPAPPEAPPQLEAEPRESEGETPAPEPPSAQEPELTAWLQDLDEKLEALSASFDTKLAFDKHKNQQIDQLHRELQEYKQDLLGKALRPLLTGLVQVHDHLGQMGERLVGLGEPMSSAEVAKVLEEFQEDVEILLDENGVSLFTEPVARFEPRRQTARRTLETDRSEIVGHIARRIRPGFERDGQVLQKERVDVFVARPPSDPERPVFAISQDDTDPEPTAN